MLNSGPAVLDQRWLVGVLAIGAGGFLVLVSALTGSWQLPALLLVYALLVILAVQRPVATIGLYVMASTLPYLFMMTPWYDLGGFVIGGGLRAMDLVLLAMAAAIPLYLTPMSRPRTDENKMDLVDCLSSVRRIGQRWRATRAPRRWRSGWGRGDVSVISARHPTSVASGWSWLLSFATSLPRKAINSNLP